MSVRKLLIGWRGFGLLSSSRTLSPTALSLPVLSDIGTMSSEPLTAYEESIYERLEESLFEYMEEDMIDKLIPALKRGLFEELARRRQEVTKLESVIDALFKVEN